MRRRARSQGQEEEETKNGGDNSLAHKKVAVEPPIEVKDANARRIRVLENEIKSLRASIVDLERVNAMLLDQLDQRDNEVKGYICSRFSTKDKRLALIEELSEYVGQGLHAIASTAFPTNPPTTADLKAYKHERFIESLISPPTVTTYPPPAADKVLMDIVDKV